MYLQKREIIKECTDGGSIGEPPMLKSNARYLDKNICSESIEVRKRVCTLNWGVSLLYIGGFRFQADCWH